MELRNFFKKNNSKNTDQNSCEFNPKNTRKKFLKIFAAASLALITCATTLLATAPFGTGDASAAANSNLSNNTQTTSTLGLDHENDQIIYTTASGIEVKFHENYRNITTPALSGYPYVTMGAYNGVPVNWVIIGVSTTMFGLQEDEWSSYFEGSSPAGLGVSNSNLKVACFMKFTNIVKNAEITEDCVLLISETNLGNAGKGDDYATSELKSAMETLYNNTLNISQHYKDNIVSQTIHSSGVDSKGYGIFSETQNAYFFPLAWGNTAQEFLYETYFTSTSMSISYDFNTTTASVWRLRSDSNYNCGQVVKANGTLVNASANNNTTLYGVRPACVFRLH